VNSPNKLIQSFLGSKIWIPIVLGISISIYLIFQSINETRFVQVQSGEKGTHSWFDANEDNEINFQDNNEFVVAENGTYRKEKISDILKTIDWTYNSYLWLFIAFVMMFVRDFGYMLRIRLLSDKQLSWKQSFFVIMIWEFASALTPGVVGGTAVAMFILNKEKIAMGRATAIVVITALMDNLFFVLIVPFILLFIQIDNLFPSTATDGLNQSVYYLFWIGYSAMVAVCLVLFMSIFLFPNLIKKILTTFTKIKFLKRFQVKAEQVGNEIRETSRQFKSKSLKFWFSIFLTTVISWTGRYLVINMLLMAFLTIGWSQHILILSKQFVMWVLMLVSPTPGASGMAEWAFSTLLVDFAPSAFLIVALAVVWRLISYFPYLLIGAIVLPKWLKSKK
jgi:glycosyltransferase 2 family protein